MISLELESARAFADKTEFKTSLVKAGNILDQIRAGGGAGPEWHGWRRILEHPNDAELEKLTRRAEAIREDADLFIVCGIGGSYLGAKAVIEALGHMTPDHAPEIRFAGHHLGGNYLENLISYMEKPNSSGEPKSIYMNVISKSGSTLETALSFKVLKQWFENRYGEEASRRILVTTGPEGGVLNRLVAESGYEKFVIPDDVGGRFSVLTPVGLLPVAVSGVDIQTLFYGAVSMYESCEASAEDVLEYAALRYNFHNSGKIVDIIGSFEPELQSFAGWIQQLLGESEGKNGKGIFPVPASYSTDLHSIGQIIQEGRRNMIETFLIVTDPISKLGSDATDAGDGLEFLSGKTFHEINRHALEGTVEAHSEGGVPVFKIILKKLNEQNVGELIYFFELFTAVYVQMLGSNPFDQPGVEAYKNAMYRKMGKTSK